jgi:chitodextrinase
MRDGLRMGGLRAVSWVGVVILLVALIPANPSPDASPISPNVVPCPGIMASSPQTLSTKPPPGILCPGVLIGTYLGGSATDWATDVAIDAAGNTYVTGLTNSTDFPVSSGAYDPTYNADFDAFLAEFTAGGSLVFSTLLGGASFDRGLSIEIDSSGYVYVAGSTKSSDFPTTPDAFDRTYGGQDFDIFLAKFRPDGSLLYSTYLGGSGRDVAWAMAVDRQGSVYLTGDSNSTDFPTTPGAFVVRRTDEEDGRDVFVTKLTADGDTLAYSSLFGGESGDQAYSIAVDDAGSAHVAGWTASPDFPTTAGAFDTTWNGFGDAFVLRLNPPGTAPVFSTFLGSADREVHDCEGASEIVLDPVGDIYLAGGTCSDFPTTAGAYDVTPNGGSDAWLSKLDASGNLLFSTLLGGGDEEEALDLRLDDSGKVIIAGYSRSSPFPTFTGAYDATYNGGGDVFVARFEPDGSRLNYSTYLGGGDTFLYGEEWAFPLSGSGTPWSCYGVNPLCGDIARAMALGADGSVTLVGTTTSADLPVTIGAFDTTYHGFIDAFLTRIDFLPEPERPPVAHFEVTFFPDAEVQSRYIVLVDASGSADAEHDDALLEVRWDWEDDGIWDTDWSTSKEALHEYGGPGTYTIRLEVRDKAGLTAGVTRQVQLGGGASASLLAFATPSRGTVPLVVNFVSDVSGGVPPYSYEWNFGDGHVSTVATAVHTYEVERTYTAVLTVTDSANRRMTWQQSIVVDPPQRPPGFQMGPWLYAAAAAPIAIGLGALFWRRRRNRRGESSP